MRKKSKQYLDVILQVLRPKIFVARTCDGENQKRSKVEHGHIWNVQSDCFVIVYDLNVISGRLFKSGRKKTTRGKET